MDATVLLRHWAWVGWGGGINVHVPCVHTWMLRCCYVTGHGWGGGILTFMYLAYTRGCYAPATSLGMGGVGGILTFMYLAYTCGCHAHGVVVSHPLRMQKALGSIPSVSTLAGHSVAAHKYFHWSTTVPAQTWQFSGKNWEMALFFYGEKLLITIPGSFLRAKMKQIQFVVVN